jgi:hypothetical protein
VEEGQARVQPVLVEVLDAFTRRRVGVELIRLPPCAA